MSNGRGPAARYNVSFSETEAWLSFFGAFNESIDRFQCAVVPAGNTAQTGAYRVYAGNADRSSAVIHF